jgi:hypothetical protein
MTYDAIACQASVEEMLNTGFIVYPNPAKGELNLHVDATSISYYEILDIRGRVVMKGDVNNQVLVKLNIANLEAGSYIVKAQTPNGIAQRSIVIQ